MSFVSTTLNWGTAVLTAATGTIELVWQKAKGLGLWLFGIVIAATGIAKAIYTFIILMLDRAFTSLGELAGAVGGIENDFSAPVGLVLDALRFTNYFFPLEEMFAFAAALVALWVLGMLYRLVKSWIPSLS